MREIKNKIFPNRFSKEIDNFKNRRVELYRNYISKGDLCFDVGANKGDVTEPLLNIGAKVIAIEPQTNCFNYLRWKFGNDIEIIKKGLGEKEEIKEMFISDADTISSFSETWISKVKEQRFKTNKWNKTEAVEMTTLDNLIAKFGVPKFIKIDVEGYELEVLRGLSHKIPLISFEYTVPEQVDNLMQCLKRLTDINPNAVYNYSMGSSMTLELNDWTTSIGMFEVIKTEKFLSTSMGDIYAKSFQL
ncbi:MAG TPA: FkbM family methyltransferase [Chitinophagaceae bacterium]|jgi:FkbM family methyltransferase|nr:FkbM family methyltransferase [Chitinophagaceae bacterium]